MNPRWRMLLWEQWRTAGVLCLAFCAISVLCTLVMHIQLSSNEIRAKDAAQIYRWFMYVFPLYFSLVLTVRQSGSSDISWDFEPRLLRLPMRIWTIFVNTLSIRVACMIILIVLNAFLAQTFSPSITEIRLIYLVLPLHAYLVLQAAAWSYQHAPIIPIGAAAFFITEVIACRFIAGYDENIYQLLNRLITQPVTVTIVPFAAIALMAYGIYLKRRDEHFGPPGLSELLEQANNLISTSIGTVHSSFDAQFWYECRRQGRILPLTMLLFTAIATIVIVIIDNEFLFNSGAGQYLPLVMLPLAAIPAGAVIMSHRNSYVYLRPFPDNLIANVQLLTMMRALLFTLPLAGILSFLFVLASPAEKELILSSWYRGDTDVLEILVFIIKPLALSAFVAWIFLWTSSLLIALIIVASMSFIFLNISCIEFMFDGWKIYTPFNEMIFGIAGIILAIALSSIFFHAYKKNVSNAQFLTQVFFLIFFTALFWFGSRYMEGLMGFLIAVACGALCVLPLTSLTCTIEMQRHRVKR